MPSQKIWTLFGATGATGSRVLRSLLRAPPAGLQLNIQVQSRARLLATFPILEKQALDANLSIQVIEGNETDPLVLDKCLEGTEVIIMCIPRHGSHRHTTFHSDTATALISGLRRRRQQQHKLGTDSYQAPTIVQLQLAPIETKKANQIRKIVHKMVPFGNQNGYADLKRACKLYAAAAAAEGTGSLHALLSYIFIDLPVIYSNSATQSTMPKLNDTEEQDDALNYPDLSEEMVDIGQWVTELRQVAAVNALVQAKGTFNVARGYTISGAKERVLNGVTRSRLFLLDGMCYMGLAIGCLPGTVAC